METKLNLLQRKLKMVATRQFKYTLEDDLVYVHREGSDEKWVLTTKSKLTEEGDQVWLHREGSDEFDVLHLGDWEAYLDVAMAYGWTPRGTVHDGIDDWDGSFYCCRGQKVTCEDALNLAHALSKAAADNYQKLGTKDASVPPSLISYFEEGQFYMGWA
jgi:hypothetical protein